MSQLARWLWEGRTVAARAARFGLGPAALGVDAVTTLRVSAYRSGLLVRRTLPLPSISIGNLSVGGTGKTPVASWFAGYFADRGITPGILLRGYGNDEGQVHRQATPGAVVVEDPDRVRGAHLAKSRGAQVLVLDDAFQRVDVQRDFDVVLVAAESVNASPKLLPAGPWRERWAALKRAHLVIVTRKRASAEAAGRFADRLTGHLAAGCPTAIVQLHLSSFEGLFSGTRHPLSVMRGSRILAVAGVGDPASFGAQLEELGAEVKLQAWPDHHPFTPADVARITEAARGKHAVVMTQKDAVKLRRIWPVSSPEPLVANISARWERCGPQVEHALHDLTTHCGGSR